jgi:hypothetical protein
VDEDQLTEVLRSRWTRARSRLGLADARDPAFGEIGLGKSLGTPSVRLAILPRDPEAIRADFDDAFWEWWRQARPDPAARGNLQWGGHRFTSIDEAAMVEVYDGDWEQYLAVLRSGGLDLGLGAAVRFNRNDRGDPQGLQLIKVVGRVWAALAAYEAVIERYEVAGPWQLALALVGVGRSELGLLAGGWDHRRMGQPAIELPDDQLFCCDISSWPQDAAGVQQLTFRLGGIIADAWGLAAHPFLIPNGESAGQFDHAQYRNA